MSDKKTIIEEELEKLGWTFNAASQEWHNDDPEKEQFRGLAFPLEAALASIEALKRLEQKFNRPDPSI